MPTHWAPATRPRCGIEPDCQLGRGGHELQLSLSRALLDLGDVAAGLLAAASRHPDPAVATHARVTEVMRRHPETGFEDALAQARLRHAHR